MKEVFEKVFLFWALYLIALLLFIGPCSEARSEVKQLSLELKRMPFNRDYFIPEQTEWDYESSLLWDVRLGRWFMENDITGRTANSRYRYVSWKFTTGFTITDYLDFVWSHQSQHLIDWESKKFPVVDSYGIRLNFVERSK